MLTGARADDGGEYAGAQCMVDIARILRHLTQDPGDFTLSC